MKTRIEYVKNKFKFGYIGMNDFAAKSLKIPFHHKEPEHVIEIYKKEPKKIREHTERHEEAESYFEEKRNYPYRKAHKKALKFEKLNKPFPKKNIKKILKRWGL